MQRIIFLLALIGVFGLSVLGQARTVTNADLAKFADKRIAAEREYRENYERLGMPSPEELEKQNAADAVEREKLSRRLRAERLQQEAIEAQWLAAESINRSTIILSSPQYSNSGYGNYYQSYPYYYGGYYPVHRPTRPVNDPVFNRFRGNRNGSYYPWMIIRTPTITPNFGGFPRRH